MNLHSRSDALEDVVAAALRAALLSGLPSTLYELATRGDPLAASVAAGSFLLPREQRRSRLLIAAIPVHLALSFGWTFVLARVLPHRRPIIEGGLAGLAIAALDLGIVGRKNPRIRSLPVAPQVADHIAFGVIASRGLSRRQAIPT